MDNLAASVIGDVALMLVVSACFGVAARRCRQPAVIGQILAGILLGPSLLGRLPGHFTTRLFSPAAHTSLTALAQIAVVLFMFSVGYHLDLRRLSGQRRAVPLVAAAALLVPLALGSGTALALRPAFASLGDPHISRGFLLYMGVTMSITALPVLAAIVAERGIADTVAAVTAVAAAGIMDAAAWLILAAAVLAGGHQPGRPLWLTAILTAAFVTVMLTAVRPALRTWLTSRPLSSSGTLLLAAALAFGSAWVTGSLGLHPVFGGFLAGLTMPRLGHTTDQAVLRSLKDIGQLLLPLFFLETGLSMTAGGLTGLALPVLLVICVVASVGKLVPAYAAARAGGLDHEDSAVVAILINTRGLTELIVLNIGLTTGLLSPQLFTVFVLMAVFTTCLTAPLLSLAGKLAGRLPVTTPAAGRRSGTPHPPVRRSAR
jgi:Kef-type K+ transport system membrane component KefB